LRELSLHLLDVIENSMRAKATIIRISMIKKENFLSLSVEDDGPGLPVTAEEALNPFFTTKKGKKTGLGLSLFKASAEQAGGDFSLGISPLGGVEVTARFQFDHWDRAPLGSFQETIQTVAMSAPTIVWVCYIEGNGTQSTLILQQFQEEAAGSLITALRNFTRAIGQALQAAGITS
jgi:signal transduction histidine kinase